MHKGAGAAGKTGESTLEKTGSRGKVPSRDLPDHFNFGLSNQSLEYPPNKV